MTRRGTTFLAALASLNVTIAGLQWSGKALQHHLNCDWVPALSVASAAQAGADMSGTEI
jgi:hypothetical protein